ncbi:hypothetical protein SUGI_1012000 [Cryptomeria japonica]|uniref:root phototropism protein 3 n=1 Tax=Cryptomeria japonica TaxID=3369 RepID=UPI002414ACEE|nr:root phototropism protein 3 [Cryptomeria japonica]GLJ47933.1 hypothetical protein SUGI_1012000 [Cryptomeria japonica]
MMLSYSIEGKPAKKTLTQEWKGERGEQSDRKYAPMDWWFEDLCMLDMDYFVRTVTAIKSKGVSPDMIGAVICNYAMKWLPGLAQDQHTSAYLLENMADAKEIIESAENENSMAKNRFILETLVGILPEEKDVVSCSFLLRLLRMAHIVGADVKFKAELERRIGLQLEQATVSDLLIPSFSHTSHTLFDVRLVYRLVKCFLAQDGNLGEDDGARSGRSAKLKVAKILDSYLAEVGQDKSFSVSDFEALAEALPSYARTCDDGLYRAIDTYLKAHPGLSDTERKRLCRLMDCKKLSVDACMHAGQNERLPVRTVVQLLFTEQMKFRNAKLAEKTAPPPNERSPCPAHGYDKARCSSERENNYDIRSLPLELQKIRADFAELRKQCQLIQQQVDKLSKQKTFFQWINGWKKIPKTTADKLYDQCSVEDDFPVPSPQPTQTRRKGKWRRNSVS